MHTMGKKKDGQESAAQKAMRRAFANSHFVLMGKLAVPEPDLFKWAAWYETANRHVAHTKVGKVLVSTVFLGLDHSFGRGLPLLFETMIFQAKDGKRDWHGEECWRCETWEQAEKQHKDAVAMVRKAIKEQVNK
jgi:hypothetical protein